MLLNDKRQSVRDLFESFDRKFNPEQTLRGRRVANKEFAKKFMELVEAKKIKESQISFKELAEQLCGGVSDQDLEENLNTSAFPVITSQLISSKIIAAYEAFPKVGLGLVTVVPSRLKEGRVAGWQAIGAVQVVKERADYLEIIPPDQKFVAVKHDKVGGLLSLTREDIFHDNTGELMNRAGAIGTEAARHQDEGILAIVTDKNSVAYNKGQLYKTDNSNENYRSGAGSVLGTSSFEATHVLLNKKTDERGKPIMVLGRKPVLLHGATLEPMAFKLKNNEYGPQGTANLDRNFAFNRFDPVLNPYQDGAISTTGWFYGDFKSQFVYEECWPVEVFSRIGQDSEDGFKKDLIQQWKAGYYGGAGATDFRYVIKNVGS